MLTNFFIRKKLYKTFFYFLAVSLLVFIISNVKTIYSITKCDAPVEWQIDFNEVASPTMEGIVNFNNSLLFVLCFIAIFVSWLLINCIFFYIEDKNSTTSKFTHSNELEIVWTSVPAIILLFLATPSFSLLYSMDEISDPTISLKIIGHQWYWSYELSDYNFAKGIFTNTENGSGVTEFEPSNESTILKYNCYMADLESIPDKQGYFRLLETNKRILLPIKTHIRLLVSAADVLHSWTVPSFGVKVDACPGRLNQLNLFIKRAGLFFGQCSEICGVNHAFMPISVVGVEQKVYGMFLYEQLIKHTT